MALMGTRTKAELALVLVVETIAAATALVEDMAINRTAAATRGSLRIDIPLLVQAFSSLPRGKRCRASRDGETFDKGVLVQPPRKLQSTQTGPPPALNFSSEVFRSALKIQEPCLNLLHLDPCGDGHFLAAYWNAIYRNDALSTCRTNATEHTNFDDVLHPSSTVICDSTLLQSLPCGEVYTQLAVSVSVADF
jgi:hypothetical protein